MISTIVDVAAALADQLHTAEDHVAAQEAATRGLAASPCHEPLWHACWREARARGDAAEEQRLKARFRASCSDEEDA